MKKTTWFITFCIATLAYLAAVIAAFTGEGALFQTNVIAENMYYLATQHAYVFETVAIVAYALAFAGLFNIAPKSIGNVLSKIGNNGFALVTCSVLLAAPALVPVVIGLLKVNA